MIRGTHKARQPAKEVWSRERLIHERAIALGNVLDCSTLSNYSSALNSYLNFVKLHGFPVDPTPETLSFYTVYMCHHVNPRSVNTYLSGISQQLEAHFLLRLRRSKAFSAQYFYTVVVSLKLFRCFCKQVWSQVFIKLS